MQKKNIQFILIISFILLIVSCTDKREKASKLVTDALLKTDKSDFQGALIDFNKAIMLDSSDSKIWFLRANIKMDLKLFEEAISDYNKSIELNDKSIDAYYNRGYAYSIIGNQEKACENYFIAFKMGKPNIEDKLKNCREILK